MTEKPLIDWLSYKAYEFNRFRFPHIDPSRWAKIFSQAEEYEEIFNNYLKGKDYVYFSHEQISA